MTDSASPAGDVAPACYRHPTRETHVRCTRCERPICPDCMRSASVGFQCPDCVKQGAATIREPKAAYGGKARARPEVTYALLGLNGLMFLLTAGGGGIGFGGSLSELFQRLALAPTRHFVSVDSVPTIVDGVAQGQYYRLLTSMFLHFGVIHLALNMYCLWLLGPQLEIALGRLRFATLYMLSGLAGSALSYAIGPSYELAAGASGAVFGLFAAFFVLERRRGNDTSQISGIIGINLVFSFVVANIDWRGHVGGLIGGALVAGALVYAPAGRQRWAVQGLGCVCVAMIVIGVVVARTSQLTS